MEAAQKSFISSAYFTERVGPAAALAATTKHRRIDAGKTLTAIGTRVQEGWKKAAERAGLPLTVTGIPALASFGFTRPGRPGADHALHPGDAAPRLPRPRIASTRRSRHEDAHVAAYLDAVDGGLRPARRGPGQGRRPAAAGRPGEAHRLRPAGVARGASVRRLRAEPCPAAPVPSAYFFGAFCSCSVKRVCEASTVFSCPRWCRYQFTPANFALRANTSGCGVQVVEDRLEPEGRLPLHVQRVVDLADELVVLGVVDGQPVGHLEVAVPGDVLQLEALRVGVPDERGGVLPLVLLLRLAVGQLQGVPAHHLHVVAVGPGRGVEVADVVVGWGPRARCR